MKGPNITESLPNEARRLTICVLSAVKRRHMIGQNKKTEVIKRFVAVATIAWIIRLIISKIMTHAINNPVINLNKKRARRLFFY